MRRAIGLLTCTFLVSTAMWLLSGREPALELSAQSEPPTGSSSGGYEAAARPFMGEARKLAARGDLKGAERPARVADSFPTGWRSNEQTPKQFIETMKSPVPAAGPAKSAGTTRSASFIPPSAWSEQNRTPGAPDPFANPGETQSQFPLPVPNPQPTATVESGFEQPFTGSSESGSAQYVIPSSRKGRALILLREAQQALAAGRLDEARARALQAQQVGATFGLFENQPAHVLAAIDRASQSQTFVAPAVTGLPAVAPAPDETHETAVQLLSEARAAIASGNFETAGQKAEQAHRLETTWSAFEDSPQDVLRDIALMAEAAQDSAPAIDAEPGQRARDLVRASRQDIEAGRLSAAREKALEAARMNVAFRLLEDRPEIVLADIENALNGNPDAVAPGETRPAGSLSAVPDEADDPNSSARRPSDQGLMVSAPEGLPNAQPESTATNLRQASALRAPVDQADDTSSISANPFEVTPASASFNATEPEQTSISFESPSDEVAGPTDHNLRAPVLVPPLGASESGLQVIHPDGASALSLFNRGIVHLREGNRAAARQAFQQSHASGQRLDPHRSQQLQDFLRELAPVDRVQLTGGFVANDGSAGQTSGSGNPGFAPLNAPSELDVVAQQQDVKYDRLRTEVLNAIYRAESLREENPDQALEILDRTTANVESFDLDENSVGTLLGHLRRSQEAIRQYQEQHAPIVEMQRQNSEVIDALQREEKYQLRIEQEFADHVEKYNQLFRERRYAEAEVEARKAKELDPENPVAVTMTWKAQIAREIARGEDVKQRKEQGFLDVLHDVDLASIPISEEIVFPKDWNKLVDRRRPYGQPDNQARTEKEKQIEESLIRPVSLHFDDASISDIIKHLATVAGVSVVIDERAFADEAIGTDQPVSIDVDGIMLKSALNLLLEPYELAYTIEHEVLKITNKLRQEGQLITRAYPVADLVVPVPNFEPVHMIPGGGGLSPVRAQSGNFNVPSGGFQNPAGSALFQVNDPLGGVQPWNGMGSRNSQSAPETQADFDAITDLIIQTIEPNSWDFNAGTGTVARNESTLSLVIRQTQRVHEEIRELLAQLRRLQDLQVTVEVRFISVTDRFFERIGVDFDFNVQDTLGDLPGTPPFGSGQLEGGGGGAGGGQVGVGGIGGGGQQGGQGGGALGGLFDPAPIRAQPSRDNWPSRTVVGLSSPDEFTQDFDISFRQGSFEIGVPDFGNFNPDAGIQVGMAILSDIEAFFFIQAAQADERANLLFAPKVTLFNGQVATITDSVQRPFVISLIPTVGNFSIGFQPIIQVIPDGIFLSVQAVISADRRFVRLSISPNFTNLIDVFTFSFIGGGGGGGGGGGFGGGGGLGGGGLGGGGFGGGGFGGGGLGGGGGFGGGGLGGGGGGGGGGTITVQQPVVETISVSTTVSVPDGGTVLLGGIKRLREGRNMAGVPILNKIPYVSRLFKNTGVGRETESVMLMVTPRIIIQEEEEEIVMGGSATD